VCSPRPIARVPLRSYLVVHVERSSTALLVHLSRPTRLAGERARSAGIEADLDTTVAALALVVAGNCAADLRPSMFSVLVAAASVAAWALA